MITLCIPENGKTPDLKTEIALTKNIKDKKTMKNTLNGLQRMLSYL